MKVNSRSYIISLHSLSNNLKIVEKFRFRKVDISLNAEYMFLNQSIILQ